jgi:hypothetical protein
MKTKSLFLLFFIIFTSCRKDDGDSDIFKLTSDDRKGFTFELLKIISFPFTNLQPDFLVSAYTDKDGKLISPFLSSPDIKSRFALVDDFETYELALQSFEAFNKLEDDYVFDIVALPIRPNQIWLVKMRTENYGIILVKSSNHYEKADKNPYAEVLFKAKKCNVE